MEIAGHYDARGNRYLTYEEAAEYLSITLGTIRLYVGRGVLKSVNGRSLGFNCPRGIKYISFDQLRRYKDGPRDTRKGERALPTAADNAVLINQATAPDGNGVTRVAGIDVDTSGIDAWSSEQLARAQQIALAIVDAVNVRNKGFFGAVSDMAHAQDNTPVTLNR